ncbi:MAG: arylesterase [PS1 clade bacterium]|nr:arylesterase [PS1 clade bacterium]MBL6783484.1 arylesterase [PS1 clade bacterium]
MSALSFAYGETKPVHLVALGDSLTAGYGLAPRDGFTAQLQAALTARGHQVTVHNGGVSGDTSAGGLARLDWVIGPETDAVIIELGANDMLRGIAPHVTDKNLRQIIETLQAKGLEVMLAGMLAAPNLGAHYETQFNQLYPQLAKQYGLVFYPFFLDGVAGDPKLNLGDRIHPNSQGIEVIVNNILPTVEKLLARTTP